MGLIQDIEHFEQHCERNADRGGAEILREAREKITQTQEMVEKLLAYRIQHKDRCYYHKCNDHSDCDCGLTKTLTQAKAIQEGGA